MNVPFYLEELMRRISLDQRVKITTTTNTYENDDTYLCATGEYRAEIGYNHDDSVKFITLSHTNYDISEYKYAKNIICDLTNSRTHVVICEDDFIFMKDGITFSKKDYIDLIIADKYLLSSTLIIGAQTSINVSLAYNVDKLVVGVKLEFKYVQYVPDSI